MTQSKRIRHKNGSGRTMLWILLGLSVCIVVFMLLLYPIVMIGASKEANIKIPKDATKEMVRDSLEKYLGKEYSDHVMRLASLRNVDFGRRYGAYTIDSGMNVLGGMRRLTSGAQTPVRITINGFRSLPLLIDRISSKMDFPSDSLRVLLENPEIMAAYGLTPQNAMALFLDDTYEVYWSNSARELIKKIGDHYLYVWNPSRTRQAAELGLTPADVTILASIVDEESNFKPEKGTIGRLYINRLNSKMKLQADPTVRFAIGDFTINRVTKKDLRTESPYNTYLIPGLPPGPIRTTSEETIKSILESKPNNYLYMCAKEDFSGSHNFATTYDEHLDNATRYQKALDKRGITR